MHKSDEFENCELEDDLRRGALILPEALRDRVLDACAAKSVLQAQRNRRANWRLAWGFAVLCAIHFGVGGALDAQQQNLLGNPPSSDSTLYADAAHQESFRQFAVMRAQFMAQLADRRHDFGGRNFS